MNSREGEAAGKPGQNKVGAAGILNTLNCQPLPRIPSLEVIDLIVMQELGTV